MTTQHPDRLRLHALIIDEASRLRGFVDVLVHDAVERLFVGPGRCPIAADLPHELERGRSHLFFSRRLFRPA